MSHALTVSQQAIDDRFSDEFNEKYECEASEYCHYTTDGDHEFSIPLLDQMIVLKQEPTALNSASSLGIGAVVWDSSVVFAKYVEKCRHNIFSSKKMASKTVLELGAGCGLAGLSLLLRGCEVTFTDTSQVIKSLTEPNVNISYRRFLSNGSVHVNKLLEPKVLTLDWSLFANGDQSLDHNPSMHRTSAPLEDLRCPYDIILCTDCIFSIETTKDLIRTIVLCSGVKSSVICCYETRDEALETEFLKEFRKHFNWRLLNRKHLDERYSSDRINVILGTRRR